MSLRFALLGFLSTEPATGYTIAKEFGESMGWFWSALRGQIHPELRRLEAEGLIVGRETTKGERMRKVVYEITGKGLAELHAWLAGDTEYPPVRDVMRTKTIFLDAASPEVIERQLRRHREHHEALLKGYREQLAAVNDGTQPRLVKRLAKYPPQQHELVIGLKRLALEAMVERAETEIAWADRALAWLHEITDGSAGGHR
jgi:DNA-binding PadR family transcriptional regulator